MAGKDFFMKMVGKRKGGKKSIAPSEETAKKFGKGGKAKGKKSIFSKKEEE